MTLFEFPFTESENTEEYRSGHNEPHSKCGVGQPTVGSNPTSSARTFQIRMRRILYLYKVGSVLLSGDNNKKQPGRLVSARLFSVTLFYLFQKGIP